MGESNWARYTPIQLEQLRLPHCPASVRCTLRSTYSDINDNNNNNRKLNRNWKEMSRKKNKIASHIVRHPYTYARWLEFSLLNRSTMVHATNQSACHSRGRVWEKNVHSKWYTYLWMRKCRTRDALESIHDATSQSTDYNKYRYIYFDSKHSLTLWWVVVASLHAFANIFRWLRCGYRFRHSCTVCPQLDLLLILIHFLQPTTGDSLINTCTEHTVNCMDWQWMQRPSSVECIEPCSAPAATNELEMIDLILCCKLHDFIGNQFTSMCHCETLAVPRTK